MLDEVTGTDDDQGRDLGPLVVDAQLDFVELHEQAEAAHVEVVDRKGERVEDRGIGAKADAGVGQAAVERGTLDDRALGAAAVEGRA